MTFSGITTSLTQSAKSLNGLVTKMGSQLQTQFGPAINSVKESLDVLKAGQDVVSTMVKDVSGQNVTIRDIQKGASDFDKKWDAFAKEVNEKFNTAPAGSQADVMETFARSHFGDDIYNLGSAIKNQLPGVLDGVADYQEAVNNMRSDSKTAEEAAGKIQSGVEKMIKATEKVAQSLNDTVEICTGNGLPILDELSNIGSSASVANLNKVLSLGVSGATVATAGSQLKESLKNKDLRGVTDALAKGATSVNSLLKDLSNLVPGFPNAQIPAQITNSIKRLQNGKDVYDAAGAMLTALVADASGPTTVASLAGLTTHFNQNWDTFSSKIDALFQVTPSSGQQAVLETVAKSLFGDNVFFASGAIKRQLPGVLSGVADVQDAIKQFGGSYRNPIEAATKIRNGVEIMVQAVEKISQSLNNMIKHYQGRGDITKGTGLPLLDALGNIGDSKGIKALDTALRIGGGTAAVVGNAGAVAQAIKNKDIPGAIAAVKKTIDDVKKLTKKGNYKAGGNQSSATGLPNNSSKTSNSNDNTNQQSQKSKNGLSSASTDSYVCSGATMRCTMGTSQARLTVLPSRTVYLTGQPMANISDHLSMVNLAPFGRCRSMGFPATASATAANHGTLTPMPCMHNTPFPWMGGKNDYIIKGDPALLKSSTCQCLWGGTISIVNDGQSGEGTRWIQKKKKITIAQFQEQQKIFEGEKREKEIEIENFWKEFDSQNDLSGLKGIARKMVNRNIPRNRKDLSKSGLSFNDMSVLKSMNDTEYESFWNELRTMRFRVVGSFYDKYSGKKRGKEAGRYSFMNGVDADKPIIISTTPPPTKMYQYKRKNAGLGEFFTSDEKATETQLGLYDKYYDIRSGKEEIRDHVSCNFMNPQISLKSTSNSVIDNWSNPNKLVQTEGGAPQIYIPRNNVPEKDRNQLNESIHPLKRAS